jgi:RHH-type proline utilization regulon transcriptional repressor/proline dehydrogenase/delta 1-pyrroline-5-carboxylate dehydrogenase
VGRYAALGTWAVIAPWNFPFAIATGMTTAALAAGNAVLLKPAEQSPACALEVVRALHAGGVPPGVLALLPGHGEVGAALVAHAGVHGIAFTGSSAVGLEIVRRSAEARPGQRFVKRVIAEMGGKNCIIVDSDADLDEVVPGVLRSGFAYAGQKCSAASRVLVHERIADELFERLSGALGTLLTGPAEDFGVDLPALIEREAAERVERYIDGARAAGAEVVRGPPAQTAHAHGGWYCAPAIVRGVEPSWPICREEVFGPLLTVESVASVDAACELVDELPFALTGGLYARNPEVVSAVAARLPVGNLYVNRHITGAMVGRQPFGGGRLSGTGGKAGGPDYLLHFCEPRNLTENTVRHGLVV